jgi:hypothetical protein
VAIGVGVLALLLTAGCDAPKRQFTAVPPTRANGVELGISVTPAPEVDLSYHVHNGSDRCIAFPSVALPRGDVIYLDNILSLTDRDGRSLNRRIMPNPGSIERHSFVLLPPGADVATSLDVRRIFGVRDLAGYTLVISAQYVPCEVLVRPSTEGASNELRSPPIAFH